MCILWILFTFFIIIWGIDCLSAQKWRKCRLGLSNPPPCLFQCVMELSHCHLWVWQLGELHGNRHATLWQNSCTLFILSLSGWAWFLHKNNSFSDPNSISFKILWKGKNTKCNVFCHWSPITWQWFLWVYLPQGGHKDSNLILLDLLQYWRKKNDLIL